MCIRDRNNRGSVWGTPTQAALTASNMKPSGLFQNSSNVSGFGTLGNSQTGTSTPGNFGSNTTSVSSSSAPFGQQTSASMTSASRSMGQPQPSPGFGGTLFGGAPTTPAFGAPSPFGQLKPTSLHRRGAKQVPQILEWMLIWMQMTWRSSQRRSRFRGQRHRRS